MIELMTVLRRIVAQAPLLVRRTARSEDIMAFLTGRSGGEHVLHALYGQIVEEPVPARLTRLVFRHQSGRGR
jgi:hypothetical protein